MLREFTLHHQNLNLETLQQRILPAFTTWLGTTDQYVDNADNWSDGVPDEYTFAKFDEDTGAGFHAPEVKLLSNFVTGGMIFTSNWQSTLKIGSGAVVELHGTGGIYSGGVATIKGTVNGGGLPSAINVDQSSGGFAVTDGGKLELESVRWASHTNAGTFDVQDGGDVKLTDATLESYLTGRIRLYEGGYVHRTDDDLSGLYAYAQGLIQGIHTDDTQVAQVDVPIDVTDSGEFWVLDKAHVKQDVTIHAALQQSATFVHSFGKLNMGSESSSFEDGTKLEVVGNEYVVVSSSQLNGYTTDYTIKADVVLAVNSTFTVYKAGTTGSDLAVARIDGDLTIGSGADLLINVDTQTSHDKVVVTGDVLITPPGEGNSNDVGFKGLGTIADGPYSITFLTYASIDGSLDNYGFLGTFDLDDIKNDDWNKQGTSYALDFDVDSGMPE